MACRSTNESGFFLAIGALERLVIWYKYSIRNIAIIFNGRQCMQNEKKEKLSERELAGLGEFIQKSLIAEMKFNNINMLADVAAGSIKKINLKRPLSADPIVQASIIAYLEHYDVEVELLY